MNYDLTNSCKMEMPSAFIFDLDGVIVDTAHYHYKAWKRLADELNIAFGEKENELLKGLGRRESLDRILEMDDRQLPEEKIQQLMNRKNGWYQDNITGLSPDDILEGVSAFIKDLKDRNIKVGIGSSSKNAQHILEYLELTDVFGTVIDGTKIEKSKPDPEVFTKGAKALNTAPEDCLVFEDAGAGVTAANSGGMISVGVGSADYLGHADLVIPSFKGMTPKKLLKRLNT